jgi:hypothetical protein
LFAGQLKVWKRSRPRGFQFCHDFHEQLLHGS